MRDFRRCSASSRRTTHRGSLLLLSTWPPSTAPSAGVVSWVRVLVAISAEKSTPSRTTVGRVAMLMDQLRVYLPAIQLHKTASSTPLCESASRAGAPTAKNVAINNSIPQCGLSKWKTVKLPENAASLGLNSLVHSRSGCVRPFGGWVGGTDYFSTPVVR